MLAIRLILHNSCKTCERTIELCNPYCILLRPRVLNTDGVSEAMESKKPIKIGAKEGTGDPKLQHSVGILDRAFVEASKVLNEAQYRHMALQVRELAQSENPTQSETVDVRSIEDFYEIRDNGGVLNGINVRLFFGVDGGERWIIVLGLIKKQNNGQTPQGDKTRIRRRWRKYKNGDFGKLPL